MACIEVVFTWKAIVAAMAVMSFPLLVRGARQAFESVNPRLEMVASTLGASRFRVLATITQPLAARGILAGVTFAFARALGEFGATILVAGSIQNRTTTLPTAIYSDIQLGHGCTRLDAADRIRRFHIRHRMGQRLARAPQHPSRMKLVLEKVRLPLGS